MVAETAPGYNGPPEGRHMKGNTGIPFLARAAAALLAIAAPAPADELLH